MHSPTSLINFVLKSSENIILNNDISGLGQVHASTSLAMPLLAKLPLGEMHVVLTGKINLNSVEWGKKKKKGVK